MKDQVGYTGTIQERWIRRQGGGRKSLLQEDSEILEALERLVEPSSRGDRKVSDDELAKVNLFQADFHGENWNYVIKPKV